MTVNPNLPASVSISASPSSTICTGTSVTFTAVPTNGGSTPSYQWKKNGVNVGTNSTTYTDAGLANGNTINCVMTSNATCATGSPATSNTISMTVNFGPTISSFAPSSGVLGTSVVITGTNFLTATQVQFNSVNASFVINTATQITATVPAGATTGTIKVFNSCGNTTSQSNFIINPVAFSLKVYIEGFYRGSNALQAVANPTSFPAVCDTVTLLLADVANPASIQATDKKVISTSGNGTFSFSSSLTGSSHWLIVRHRNSIETWSASPVNFNSATLNYDFTDLITRAYGNNLVNNGDNTFSIRSGDVNQDGAINSTDFSTIQSAAQVFGTGYILTDINGDRIAESTDYSLIENNVFLNILSLHP